MGGFKSWGLGAKIALPAVIITAMATMGLAFIVNAQQRSLAVDQARRTAIAISKQVSAERQVYSEQVVTKLKKDGLSIVPTDLKSFRGLPGGIPLPASFVHATSDIVNAKGLYRVDLVSTWNINPTKGPQSPFERAALERLNDSQSDLPEEVSGEGAAAKYTLVAADVASAESCVTCHNEHPASPKRDFQVGNTMGGMVISLPLAREFENIRANTILMIVVSLGAMLFAMAGIITFQWGFVTRPLVQSLSTLEKAAEKISLGELDEPVTVKGEDEVGRLGRAFDRMRVSMQAAMQAMEDRDK